MKRILMSSVVLTFLLSALVPVASAADPNVAIQGLGSARALDLSIPLLNRLPAIGEKFPGLTAGFTSVEFSGLANSVAKGQAIGNCSLLGAGSALPQIPALCSGPGTEQTEANASKAVDGDGTQTCVANLGLAIVKLVNSCANSISKIEGGRPASLNSAGVAGIDVELDVLSSLLKSLGLSEGEKVTSALPAVQDVTKVVTGLLGAAKVPADQIEANQVPLVDEVTRLLNGLVGNNLTLDKLVNVKAGLANTDLTNNGAVTSVVSQAAGAQVGLLGLTDALTDGLVIIEVGAAKALVNWNDAEGQATAHAVPAVATAKVRDILNLLGKGTNNYIPVSIEVPALLNALSVLDGTPLETTIELASATPDAKGRSVTASSSGVNIHALKGLGASSLTAKDGGLLLRVASANAAIAGDIVKTQQAAPPLPTTGGPTYLFLVGGAILAIAAPSILRYARRLRTTA